MLEITFEWRANGQNSVLIVFTLHSIFLLISWIKKESSFEKVKMSDSEEEYEGDETPSGNESVDGNDISVDENCDLNVGIGKHSANYSRRFEDTQNLSDETWSNQSLPYNVLPFTQNVVPKNIPDTVKTPGDIFLTFSNLHLNNQTKEPKKGDANSDKLYKIMPFIEKISETYLHYYDPARE